MSLSKPERRVLEKATAARIRKMGGPSGVIAAELAAHPEARWDRFIEYGGKVRVYGWLDRDDGRSDFLLLDFDAAAGVLTDWITSAHPHPASVVERLENDSSVDCQRVENHFNIPNAVRLPNPRQEAGSD